MVEQAMKQIRKAKASIILTAFIIIGGLISCNPPQIRLSDLKRSIIKKFDSETGDFALAFRDLNDSTVSLFINEKETFHAASTYKVAVMIELFNQVASKKFQLIDSITITNEFRSIVDQSSYTLYADDDSEKELYQRIGQRISLRDLNYMMITSSSNLATNLLVDFLNPSNIMSTMRSIGARDIEVIRGVQDIKAFESGMNNTVTAFDLLLLFEAINSGFFFAGLENKQMIAILKEQKFNEIIPALLPENIEVAHKTGSITRLHHDAGIVYLPDGRGYTVVLLLKNLDDFDSATGMLAEVSKLVYDYYVVK